MYQRFIYDEMPGAFNVALNTMPDLESYLLNMDDDQIGNPDDPEVKRLQMLMNKTILGAKLWKDLENSTKTVYFKFHNSRNPKDIVGVYLFYVANAKAETMTLRDYNYIKGNGQSPPDSSDKDYTFNKETGLYDKTAEWDKTVIAFDIHSIKQRGLTEVVVNQFNEDIDKGIEIAWIDVTAHEIQHAVNQSYADLYKPYEERINEIEGREIGKKVKDELIKIYKSK